MVCLWQVVTVNLQISPWFVLNICYQQIKALKQFTNHKTKNFCGFGKKIAMIKGRPLLYQWSLTTCHIKSPACLPRGLEWFWWFKGPWPVACHLSLANSLQQWWNLSWPPVICSLSPRIYYLVPPNDQQPATHTITHKWPNHTSSQMLLATMCKLSEACATMCSLKDLQCTVEWRNVYIVLCADRWQWTMVTGDSFF